MKKAKGTAILRWAGLFLLAAALLTGTAAAEEAENLTAACVFRSSTSGYNPSGMTDANYKTYWESKESKTPWVEIESETPVYGLYLCFRTRPEAYEIQTAEGSGENWKKTAEGDIRFHHVFYPLDGAHRIRIQTTSEGKSRIGFNEVFVFGQGELPDWVQRWEPVEENADILFLAAHPDDELLFMGGAIPTYAAEMKKRVTVAYLCYSNTTRRSEALNGLWTLGVRHYPVFGEFRDVYSKDVEEAYKKIKVNGGQAVAEEWLVRLIRSVKPRVIVTHDLRGEYGHGQHQMLADCAIHCFDLAADPERYPESAAEFGTWQVQKLYIHLWGGENDQTCFDWEKPLASMGGKTGTELAEAAFELHVTQHGSGIKWKGKRHRFSIRGTGGELFPNTVFGLYASKVGPDLRHDDFLENLEE